MGAAGAYREVAGSKEEMTQTNGVARKGQPGGLMRRGTMLVVLVIGIVLYGFWAAGGAVVALMAESGGKDSKPLLALALLWPLGELIWTAIWIAREGKLFSRLPSSPKDAGKHSGDRRYY